MFTLYELAANSMHIDDVNNINNVYDIPGINLQKCCLTVVHHIVHNTDVIDVRDLMETFVEYGCRKCMKIVLISSHISYPDVCEKLAINGRLDALRYAIESGYPHNINIMCRAAAARGHVDVLAYLRSYASTGYSAFTALAAARHGRVQTLHFILSKTNVNKRVVTSLYTTSASHGHLNVIKYLHKNGYDCRDSICNIATGMGHLKILQYALNVMGLPCTSWTAVAAASSDKLDCLIYLHESGCQWDEWTCSYAAKNNSLQCLRYAYEHGCPWNAHTLANAIAGRHTKILKYILLCPFNTFNAMRDFGNYTATPHYLSRYAFTRQWH